MRTWKEKRSNSEGTGLHEPYAGIDSEPTLRIARTAPSSSKYINLAAVASIALHGGLVLLHAALLVVYSHHYEHRVTASWTKWIPAVLTMASEAFGTIYLAILVLLTQRLSLVRDICSLQTLTAIHDKHNAWLGIVSAITSVFQQCSTPAAPFGVAMIAAYLGSVLVLHVTTSSLLHFIPTNRTITTGYPTQLQEATYDFEVYSAWDVLPVYEQLPTKLGLLDNMVYDIIPALNFTVGTTKVNASLYTVDCFPLVSTLDGQTLVAQNRSDTYIYEIDNSTLISINPGTLNYGTLLTHQQSSSFFFKSPSGKTGVYAPLSGYDSFDSSQSWAPFLVSSTVPFVSKTGTLLDNNWIPLSPAVGFQLRPPNNESVFTSDLSDRFFGNITMSYIPVIQLLTCAVNITNPFVDVLSSTRMPLSTPESPSSTEAMPWWNYTNQYPTPQNPRFVSAIGAVQNAPPDSEDNFPQLEGSFALLWGASSPASMPTVYPAGDPAIDPFLGRDFDFQDYEEALVQPTVLDAFLSREVGLSNDHPAQNVSIKSVETAFAKALAGRYWYGRNLNFSDPHETFSDPSSAPQDLIKNYTITSGNGTAMITQIVEEGELDLDPIPLIAGSVSSVVLFCLSIYFIRGPKNADGAKSTESELNGVGILQLAWLLGNEPELASVSEPEVEALRKAGMFYLRLSEMAEEKTKRRRKTEAPERQMEDVNGLEAL